MGQAGGAACRAPAGGFDSLSDVLAADALGVAFQPLVDLRSRTVLGYEALARGPVGTAWSSPSVLFAAAAAEGRIVELDWACRAAVYRAALAGGLTADLPLFVNVEPVALGTPCPEHLRDVVDRAAERLRIVVEVTERAVAHDPAGLLAGVHQARAAGAGIALDDVGADPASLAMMPFLDPDVIKLDLRLIQEQTSPEAAGIVTAILAHAERTGARILAEGIELPRHVDVARSLGASIGQGFLFGRPGRLPAPPGRPPPGEPLRSRPRPPVRPAATPFSVVAAHRDTIRSDKELLLPLSSYLEQRALAVEPGVLLGCFQDARYFTPGTRRRYEQLAPGTVLTGALGVGMPAAPAAGVHSSRLDPADPLRGEWNVVVVGPQFAGALVARDLGDDGPDRQRRFDAVLTQDRALVIEAALTLVSRLVNLSGIDATATAPDRAAGHGDEHVLTLADTAVE